MRASWLTWALLAASLSSCGASSSELGTRPEASEPSGTPSPLHPSSNETAPSTAAGAPTPHASAATRPPQNGQARTTNVGAPAPPTTSCAEGTTHYLRDRDGDGYAGSEYECASGGPGLIALREAQWDCDDSDPELRFWFRRDEDGDGFGREPAICVATVSEGTTVEERLDCDDTDAAIHPSAVDFPEDTIDHNCDGQLQPSCQDFARAAMDATDFNPLLAPASPTCRGPDLSFAVLSSCPCTLSNQAFVAVQNIGAAAAPAPIVVRLKELDGERDAIFIWPGGLEPNEMTTVQAWTGGDDVVWGQVALSIDESPGECDVGNQDGAMRLQRNKCGVK